MNDEVDVGELNQHCHYYKAKKLVLQLLNKEPSERLSPKEALQSNYIIFPKTKILVRKKNNSETELISNVTSLTKSLIKDGTKIDTKEGGISSV